MILPRTRWLWSLLLALQVLAPGAGWATTVVPQDFTCPVGGQKFTANVIVSYTSWGQRPDGRSYGTLPIHPIVECPENGMLLVEQTFDPNDIAILTPLVASTDYQAMRATETPHYRGWWLLSKLQRDPYALAGLLLQASWETDGDLERKARYQSAFIAAATALKRRSTEGDGWFFLNMRAANALRELGYFDKAQLVLDRIDQPELMPAEADKIQALGKFLAGLRTLIAEKNPSPEPANLLPADEAAYRCEAGEAMLTPVELATCVDPALAAKRKMARKAVEKLRKRESRQH